MNISKLVFQTNICESPSFRFSIKLNVGDKTRTLISLLSLSKVFFVHITRLLYLAYIIN